MTEIHGFSLCLKLEQIFDEFESEWRSGTRPRLELFLTRALVRDRDAVLPDCDAVLKELLCVELEHRIQLDELPEFLDYIERFPDKNALIDLAFREAAANLDNWRPPRVTRFQTIDRLGLGGQGEVWLALDSQIDRHVALKVVKPSQKASKATLAKFRREAEVSAKLEHPNVVPVYDITQELTASGQPDPESPCFVMRVYGDPRLHTAIEAFQARPRSKEDRLLLLALQRFEKDRSGSNRAVLMQELDRFRFDEHQAGDRLLKSSVHTILEHDSEAGSLAKAIAKFHEHEWSGSELRKLLSRFQRVCEAVAYAHDRGIIHRDLKPENVMLGEFGETLVADWGLAKIVAGTNESIVEVPHPKLHIKADSEHAQTLHGGIVGTPPYMSPEQAEGRSDAIGPPTDIYSLGAMLYCILTGQAPIGAKARKSDDAVGEPTRLSTKEILARVRVGDFLPPDQVESRTPKPLAAIILKAMSLNPDHRYATVVELTDDIQRWLNDEPVSVWPEPAAVRARRWIKAHQTAVTSIAAMIIVGVLTLSVMLVVVVDEKNKTTQALQLAETNGAIATEQSQLAIDTLTSVIFDLQRSLINVPGGATVRNRLLANALPQLDKVATEFAAKSAVDHTTMVALSSLADTILQLGQNSDDRENPTGAGQSPTPEMTSAVITAERLYQRSHEIAKQLAAADPANEKAKQNVSYSFNNLGDVLLAMGRTDDAIARYQDGLKIRHTLAEADPGDAKKQSDLMVSYDRLGEVFMMAGRTSDALTFYQYALNISSALAEAAPNDIEKQLALSISYNSVGDVYLKLGRTDNALAQYEVGLKICRMLASADTSNEVMQIGLSTTLARLGTVLRKLGRTDDALACFAESVEIRIQLAGADPSDMEKQRNNSIGHLLLGDLLLSIGRIDEAIAKIKDGLKTSRLCANADPSDAQKQRDLSLALERLGNALLKLDHTNDALSAFREGLKINQTLAEADPTNVENQRNLAISFERLGTVFLKLGQTDEALANFKDQLAILRVLAAADPINVQLQCDLSLSLNKVGGVFHTIGRHDDAITMFQDSVNISRSLTAADPKDAQKQQGLSASLERVGDIFLTVGRPNDAFKPFEEVLSIRRALATADPIDSQKQRELQVSCSNLGEVFLTLGRTDEAVLLFQDGLRISRLLAEADPGNAQTQRDVSVSLSKLGDGFLRAGRTEDGLALYQDALKLSRTLSEDDPADVQKKSDLSFMLNRIGDVLKKIGRTEEALERFQDGLTISLFLAKMDPQNAEWQRDLMFSHYKIGETFVQAGEFVDARDQFTLGVAVLEGMITAGQSVTLSKGEKELLERRSQFCTEALVASGDWDALLMADTAVIPGLLSIRVSHFARLGRLADVAQAGARLRELEPKAGTNLYNATCAFSICAGLSVKDKLQPSDTELAEQKKYLDLSISCLKEAIAAGFDDYGNMRQDPDLTSLAGLPEFEALFPKQ